MDREPLRVQEILEVDQPRERLLHLGAPALSNTELVALLLEDTPGEDAAALTKRLLRKFRSLRTLARCEPRELASIEDMPMDKAIRLAASPLNSAVASPRKCSRSSRWTARRSSVS